MDILSTSYNRYLDWVAALNPAIFFLVLREALALAGSSALCGVLFRRLFHHLPPAVLLAVLWGAFLMIFLLMMGLPLCVAPVSRAARGWLFALSALILLIVPAGLAWLLAPVAGPRRLLAAGIYTGLVVLLLIQLLSKP